MGVGMRVKIGVRMKLKEIIRVRMNVRMVVRIW